MLHSLPAESRFFYCVYYSLLELLGGDKADEVFDSADLNPFDQKAPGCFRRGAELIESLAKKLYENYGEETTRGLLIRLGKASLVFFRKYFSDVAQLGSLENRLKPLGRRFLSSFDILAKVLSNEMNIVLEPHSLNSRSYVWKVDGIAQVPDSPDIIPYFLFGLLEEFCEWLDARKNYVLNYSSAKANLKTSEIMIEIKDLD